MNRIELNTGWASLLLTLAALCFNSPHLHAQAAPSACTLVWQLTATGSSSNLDLRNSNCQTLQLTYVSEGFSAVSVDVEIAPIASGGGPGTFASASSSPLYFGGTRLPLTSTTAGTIKFRLSTPSAYARVTATLTGTGTTRGVLDGSNSTPGFTDGNGVPTTPVYCTLTAAITISQGSSFTQELIAASSGRQIFVCGLMLAFSASGNLIIQSGTGTTCGTGTVNVTGTIPTLSSMNVPNSPNAVMPLTVSHALCLNGSAATTGGGIVFYALR